MSQLPALCQSRQADQVWAIRKLPPLPACTQQVYNSWSRKPTDTVPLGQHCQERGSEQGWPPPLTAVILLSASQPCLPGLPLIIPSGLPSPGKGWQKHSALLNSSEPQLPHLQNGQAVTISPQGHFKNQKKDAVWEGTSTCLACWRHVSLAVSP